MLIHLYINHVKNKQLKHRTLLICDFIVCVYVWYVREVYICMNKENDNGETLLDNCYYGVNDISPICQEIN